MSISAATHGSSLLEAAGALSVLVGHPDPCPPVPLEQVAALRPHVVLARLQGLIASLGRR